MARVLDEDERRAAVEHQDVLLDIRAMLANNSGRRFFKYLLKEFEYGHQPPLDTAPEFLRDMLGFLRAGRSIFELVAEADFNFAGSVIAEIEKERYEKLLQQANL